ncbi:hypothetical protein HYV43_07255 [Candidatus Micrarchaeota archaeon]|nr:hypothetical protein [Candidatus Micrarchaeota archaeon]
MNKKQLSTWQIARQQDETPQYVRRLAARFEKPQHVRFLLCGKKPQTLAPFAFLGFFFGEAVLFEHGVNSMMRHA